MKSAQRLFFLTITCLFLVACSRFVSPKTDDAGISDLRGQVKAFLSAWLVGTNQKSPLDFFSSVAFDNPALLGSDCVGIFDVGRQYSNDERRMGLQKFLGWFSKETTGRKLDSVLSVDRFERSEGINNWKSDRFLLSRIGKNDLPGKLFSYGEDAGVKFLSDEMESGPLYLNLVMLKFDDIDGGVTLVWKQRAGNWKVVHMDMICH